MAANKPRSALVLQPGQGRSYPMGRIAALFKADGAETAERYSISEWWLEPHTQGPGAHSHPEDDVFYVIEGVMTFRVGDEWLDAAKGANSAETFSGEDGVMKVSLITKGTSSIRSSSTRDFDIAPIFGELAHDDYNRAVECRGIAYQLRREIAQWAANEQSRIKGLDWRNAFLPVSDKPTDHTLG